MSTVHVLPCGTSILRNLEKGFGNNLPYSRLRHLLGWARDELRLDAPVSAWSGSFTRDVVPLLGSATAWSQPVALSAEIGSLLRHTPAVKSEDLVVLLASDTPNGMLAALLNAGRLNRPIHVHMRPVLDLQDSGEPLTDHGSGEPVHIIRIPGLRPVNTATFNDALHEIANAMLWAGWLRRRPHGPFAESDLVVHLAGGYKATLPYLLVLAEYLKGARSPVRAVCLHEADPDEPDIPEPVEIRLRRVNWQGDLSLLEKVHASADHPGDDRLKDFAYTRSDGRYVLNDLGTQLRLFLRCLA